MYLYTRKQIITTFIFQLYYFVYNLGIYQINFLDPYYYTSLIFLFSNGWVNSIIYGAQYGPFKSGIKLFISKLPLEEKRKKILKLFTK